MLLILQHPEVAYRSCQDCQKYVYDHKTGKRELHRGQPLQRPQGSLPPCGYGPDRCPKGSPTAGRELTDQNLQAYDHYLRCKATYSFPADPIVQRNAAIIRSIEDATARADVILAGSMRGF